jgi:acyl-CoA dehydrogenase
MTRGSTPAEAARPTHASICSPCRRAAWAKDQGAPRIAREAAMAKLYTTKAAGRVIDAAVQLHGGDGRREGSVVESLWRDARGLRIYKGATDVQRAVIARSLG